MFGSGCHVHIVTSMSGKSTLSLFSLSEMPVDMSKTLPAKQGSCSGYDGRWRGGDVLDYGRHGLFVAAMPRTRPTAIE